MEAASEVGWKRGALLRLEEASALWARFAEARQLRYGATFAMPRLEGRVERTDVAVVAVGNVFEGFRTRATASAKVPLAGKLRVAPPNDWDEILAFLKRGFFDEPSLDRMLVVKASSKSLARTLLDTRVVQTVRALAPGRLHLSYVDGAIALEWAGVERSFANLDDVLDVLAYLAVQGSETDPYR